MIESIEAINREIIKCCEQTAEPSQRKNAILTKIETLVKSYYELHFRFNMEKAAQTLAMASEPATDAMSSETKLACRTAIIQALMENLVECGISALETKQRDTQIINITQEKEENPL